MSDSNIEPDQPNNMENISVIKRGRPRKEKPEIQEHLEPTPLVTRGRPKKEKLPKAPKEPKEPKEPKPRKPRTLKDVSLWRDNPREYFRNYYHNRPKVECICPNCYSKFDSKVRLYDHSRRSTQCRKIRDIRESLKEQGNLNNLD